MYKRQVTESSSWTSKIGASARASAKSEKEMSIGQMFDEHSRKLVIPVGPLLKWGGETVKG